jgi:hypothetical protein
VTGTAREHRTDVPAPDYLRWMFQASDRIAILTRNHERGETAQRIAPLTTVVDAPFQRWLQFKNQKQASDVYVGMNPLKPEARARTKDDIVAIRHLYLDLDREAAAALSAIEVSNLVPHPNAVLDTSPGKMQVIWKVDGFSQDQAETVLRALARKFNGDPAATDSTRVLRLPGFRNHKYDDLFTVRAELRSDRVYNPHDFRLKAEIEENQPRPLRSFTERTDSTRRETLTQSEHDWAFAKRSLAKGVPAGDVIRQIAAFRANDKHNPEDYARRTVMKAQAELQALRPTERADRETDLPQGRE